MKKLSRLFLLVAIMLFCNCVSVNAQEIIIRERPVRPHYVRVAAPSPRHVWIDEEWEARGGRYVFVGGHWVSPPQPMMVWMPGHWAARPRGEVWIPGHWKERRR